MPEPIKTLFIGNRPAILNSLLKNRHIELVRILTTDKSLTNSPDCKGRISLISSSSDKHKVMDAIATSDYQLLVSAGCPYIIPAIPCLETKICINSHPSMLPFGRGKHPVNECILSGRNRAGSTLHYLSEELDAGKIIHQRSFEIGEDIDLDVLYSFIFDFECEVFEEGLQKLIESNFAFDGYAQDGETSYYSRQDLDLYFDLSTGLVEDFIRRTRAFSSDNLGMKVKLDDAVLSVHKASRIQNGFLLERYAHCAPGSVAINKNNVLIVKMKDGLVRLECWRRHTSAHPA